MLFLFLITLIAGFAGFMFGFDSSVIADVKDQIIPQLNLNDWQWSQIVSASLLGCLIGIPTSGFFSNCFSRRFILQVTAIGFIGGASLCALAYSFKMLFMGRFLVGICTGIASYMAPLFIAEIAPVERRGMLILINGLTLTFGQAMAYLAGYFFHDYSWRYFFLMSTVPATALFIGMLFVPHSPRWMLHRYGVDSALTILRKIRPVAYDVAGELHEMQKHVQQPKSDARLLLKKPVIYVVFTGIFLGVFQQSSGINAIMYYGPVIFASAGFSPVKNAILATFCIGLINFLFTVFTTLFIDRLGRRYLLLAGTLIAALSLFAVSICFNYVGASEQKFWILGFLGLYVMGYCISIGSLFWVLISEIYPLAVRGLAMSIATVIQCAVNFIVSLSFLGLLHSLGYGNTFFLFGLMCSFSLLFVYYFIPETNGVSLEKIEENLIQGKRLREIGKPLYKGLPSYPLECD